MSIGKKIERKVYFLICSIVFISACVLAKMCGGKGEILGFFIAALAFIEQIFLLVFGMKESVEEPDETEGE